MNNKETEIKYLNQDEIRDFIIQKDYKIYKLQRIIDKIKKHTTYIIGITDDERVLAECNLILNEIGEED